MIQEILTRIQTNNERNLYQHQITSKKKANQVKSNILAKMGKNRVSGSTRSLDPKTIEIIKTKLSEKTKAEIANSCVFDNNKVLQNTAEGEKFMVMERMHEVDTMKKVSPFLIDKCINGVAGPVKSIKSLINGTLLIQTANLKQAKELIKIIALPGNLKVSVKEHERLNFSKGVIWAPELIYATDEEILLNLKDYHATEIKRISKLNIKKEQINTGTFFIMFATKDLPKSVNLAYMCYEVRAFVPNPIQCFKCGRFNHIASRCDREKVCLNCSNPQHTEIGEKCAAKSKCINCHQDHFSTYKKCKVYQKYKGINSIMVQEKTSRANATKMYNLRNPEITYAETLMKDLRQKKCNCKCSCEETKAKPIIHDRLKRARNKSSEEEIIISQGSKVKKLQSMVSKKISVSDSESSCDFNDESPVTMEY